ncbi:hypothetical protein EYR41_011990 [Orbilia oligospora]|uniref:Uncharacterized protein n=1 Tax=Orbilia oligospora TaxID=2813651 RepID=A0A7C8PB49_ORBOL|nr:hypothetical protein TWF751_011153 [Orbilia oligospora]TGJ62808.1 hypothetical protein EYR41_011990 [Orbilia oligospora]
MMAKVSTLLLSAATLGILKYAPPEYLAPLIDLLSKTPVTPQRILSCVQFFAWFKLLTGVTSNINSYFSWKKENNWVTDDKYDWEKEVVMITGGSGGLGEQMAIQFAEKGVTVVVVDVNPVRNEVLEKYKTISFFSCDISDFTALSATAAEIRKAHGDPTVIILNAAIANLGPLLSTPVAQSQKLININLTSHIAMIHEFLPSMIKNNHGHVMFIASMCSYLSIAGLGDYCATKAGTLAYYEALRQELRHEYKAPKVRTSIVHPTWMRTKIVPFETVEKSGEIRVQKRLFYGVEKTAKIAVQKVFSGYGGRVIVPDVWQMRAMIGLRTWSIWAQESLRDYVRLIGQ